MTEAFLLSVPGLTNLPGKADVAHAPVLGGLGRSELKSICVVNMIGQHCVQHHSSVLLRVCDGTSERPAICRVLIMSCFMALEKKE